MENEKDIEEKLKNDFSKVSPDREKFYQMMQSVTKQNINRNRYAEGDTPSPYQINYFSYFMKKITYISIPVVLVAAFLIFINIDKANDTGTMNGITSIAPTGGLSVAEKQEVVSYDNMDVDSIVDDVFASIDDDSSLAINDSNDDTFINSELEGYSSIQTNNYEEII